MGDIKVVIDLSLMLKLIEKNVIPMIELIIVKTYAWRNIFIERYYFKRKIVTNNSKLGKKIKTRKKELLSTLPLGLECTTMR